MQQASAKNGHRRLIFQVLAVALLLTLVTVGILALTNRKPKPQPQIQKINTLARPIVQPSLVATGIEKPTAIVASSDSSDKRLYVLDQTGAIRIIDSSGQLEPNAFLDIKDKVTLSSEMGLLGLAFHPLYKTNGYLYVNYINKNQDTVIARFQASTVTRAVDKASEKVLLQIHQPYQNHNGGALVFGPDGYLYATLGDGGSAGDPQNRAQAKNSYFGKILRIDIDHGDPYSVPPSNPLAKQAGAKPEVWAYGLRNPWRISFDKLGGDLYIADVGQDNLEELDFQPAASHGGENYGWRCYEGTNSYNPAGCGTPASYVAPVLEYDHKDNRCSITGGYVYRGTANKALKGKYFYGDFCSGQLFYAERQNGKWRQTLAASTPYAISTFGQGSDGELYFADYKTGSIYKILDAANR